MTDEEILKKISTIMDEQWGIPNYSKDECVQPESHLVNDLAYDSLDTLELLMKIERDFQISIPDEEVDSATTVGDVIQLIQKQLQKAK